MSVLAAQHMQSLAAADSEYMPRADGIEVTPVTPRSQVSGTQPLLAPPALLVPPQRPTVHLCVCLSVCLLIVVPVGHCTALLSLTRGL